MKLRNCETCPEYGLGIYNTLAYEGLFPTVWKMSNLVLIPKGTNLTLNSTLYRSLCFLDLEAKLFST